MAFQVGVLGLEYRFIYRARKVTVEQVVLHAGQLSLALGQRLLPLTFQRPDVLERPLHRGAEPRGNLRVRHPQCLKLVYDGLIQALFGPTDHEVLFVRMVVGATVVLVLVDTAAEEPATNPFARQSEAAESAPEQAAGVVVVQVASAPVTAMQHVLAYLEGFSVHQEPVLALVDTAIAVQFADIEPVVQDVAEDRAVEAWLAGTVDEPFAGQPVANRLEGVMARRVHLEDAHERLGLDGMGLYWLVVALHVEVAEGGETVGPALAIFLVNAFENFATQVVRVVLRDRGHHVERQRPCGAGAELVVDKCELHPALVFKFLEANRVSHVPADAVQFVGKDDLDPVLPRAGPNPIEHLVERHALCAALGGLGDHKLAQYRPSVLRRPFPVGAELRIQRVPRPP